MHTANPLCHLTQPEETLLFAKLSAGIRRISRALLVQTVCSAAASGNAKCSS